jgi:ubiquitin-conjugating enzyme E2 variant
MAQRLLEVAAIALFALLAARGLARLEPLAALAALPLAWVAADLLGGLVHWACDSFGSVRTPLLGRAFIAPFRAHHADPEGMTRHDFVETHGASCLAALPLFAAAGFAPWPFLDALLVLTALGALATNQCHKWAHLAEAATPRAVRVLQRAGLVLRREHHRRHHTAPFDTHFCTTSGWMNAPLDALLRAWR